MSAPTPAHLAKVADTLGSLKIFTRYYGDAYIATAHGTGLNFKGKGGKK